MHDRLREALGADIFATAWAMGRSLSPEDALASALAVSAGEVTENPRDSCRRAQRNGAGIVRQGF
jgi:DNA-binding transcriptional MocR family regulator